MWDWLTYSAGLQNREKTQRDAFGSGLTPTSRDALMDAIRRTIPAESRPDTFESALEKGTLDPGILDLLLGAIRAKVPQPPAPSGGSGGGWMASR